MRKISAISRIVISLVAISTSLMLIAGAMGFFPDRRNDIVDGRMRIGESLALSFSTMAPLTNTETIADYFRSVAARNDDIVSIGLRKSNGILLFEIGDHDSEWISLVSDKSNDCQIAIPVDSSTGRWGTVEIQFRPVTDPGLAGIVLRKEFTLTAFMAVAMCFSYYFYLRRVLTQLNPSKVIPGRVKEAFDSLAEGILVMDAHEQVILANRAFEKATGKSNQQLLGSSVKELAFVCRDENEAELLPWDETVHQNTTVSGRLLGRDQDAKTFSVSSTPIVDERGVNKGVLASFEDVTQLRDKKQELLQIVNQLHKSSREIQRQNRELEQLANHDALTGCLNRRVFFDKMDSLWKSASRYNSPLSAIMVDIDHFKSVNDNHGHAVGDEVLRKVAGVLQDKVRDSDILCRYGGEEFAVLLPHTGIDQAAHAAERYREAVAALQLPDLSVTASLGVSALSESPASPQELLDQADKCLYIAKRSGRNQVSRWDERPVENIEEDVSVVTEPLEPVSDLNSIPYHAVTALVSALAFRDQETATHSRRVADYCVAMAEGLLSLRDCYTLEMAALLHDIGKIGVPDAILLKAERLTPSEWEVMMSYSRIGIEIVHASFASPALTELVQTYRQKYQPDEQDVGREKTSVGARILAVADAYDSMTSYRPYRKSRSHEEAMAELRKHSGSQFDPVLVDRIDRVVRLGTTATTTQQTDHTSDIAMNIGEQLGRLISALDDQDLASMSILAERLETTATRYGADEIAQKAHELRNSVQSDEDLFGVMQIASELLDLCRSTQSALLDRPILLRQSLDSAIGSPPVTVG